MWALIRKELLENVRWLPLACLLTCSLTVTAVQSGWLSDVSALILNSMYGSGLLALSFGLLQAIPDERNGSRAYLLHRGVTAAQAFWAKTLVGFALVSISVAVPLAICALWLELRGVLGAPGRPVQVLPAAVIALAAFVFHPTAMLIIVRPARWLGSRVLPICVPIGWLILCQRTLDGEIDAQHLVWTLAGSGIVLSLMVAAAYRAYVDLARQPSASSRAHRSPVVMLIMLASMLLLTALAGVGIKTIDLAIRPLDLRYFQVVLNKQDNQLWLVRFQMRWMKEKNERGVDYLNGAPLSDRGMPDISPAIPRDFEPERSIVLDASTRQDLYGIQDIAYRQFNGGINYQRWDTIADRRGYILCYERYALSERRLGQVISRDGIRDPQGDWGRPFSHLFEVDSYSRDLGIVGDENGIYQLDEVDGVVVPLIERALTHATLSYAPKELLLLVRLGSTLAVYELSDESGVLKIPEDYGRVKSRGRLSARLLDEFELPQQVAQLPTWEVFYRGVNDWTVNGKGGVGVYASGSVAQRRPEQSQTLTFTAVFPPVTYPVSMRDILYATVLNAPLPSLVQPFWVYLTEGREQHKSLAEVASVPAVWLPWVVAMFLLQGGVAASLTYYASQRRGLSLLATWSWCAMALALGWAVPMSVLACYPRLVRETCTHCRKPRRVDLSRCEHCQAAWEKPQRDGIEIIEHEFDTACLVQPVGS